MNFPNGIRSLTFLFAITYSLSGFASLQATLKWNGQNQDVLKMEDTLKVIRSVPVEVDGTCTRQVPKPVRVCEDVERTRQSCHQVPAARVCEDEESESCSNVPSTSEVCDTGSRRVCSSAPTRDVCIERPTRDVCTTTPSGRQHCTTVGGGTHCTTVGGGQECHDEATETNCRDVTTYERECTTEVEEVCRNVPAHRECDDVPYTENVCRTVMQAVTEQYACRQTVNKDVEMTKKVAVDLNVSILTNGLVGEIPVLFKIVPVDARVSGFTWKVDLVKEPALIVISKAMNLKLVSETKEAITLRADATFEMTELKTILPVLPEVVSATFIKRGTTLQLNLSSPMPAKGTVDVTLTNKKKPFAALQAELPSRAINLGAPGPAQVLAIDLGGKVVGELGLFKDLRLALKLTSPIAVEGLIMNQNFQHSSEKVQENIKVKIVK